MPDIPYTPQWAERCHLNCSFLAGSKTSPNTWFLGPRFRVRLDVAKFFYSNRVFNELNMLSEEIIAGNSLSGFIR